MGATDVDLSGLAAPFAPADIEWRLQSAGKNANGIWGKCLAYITNRAIMERLDKVCGPGNWKNEYREWTIGTAGVLCGLSIRIDEEWITKWDGAEQTDVEAMKGGLSAAMKRAAVQWGIGRYLYDLPEGWAKIAERGEHFGRTKDGTEFRWDNPDLPKWAIPNGVPPSVKGAASPSARSSPPAASTVGTTPTRTTAPTNPVVPTVKDGPYAPSAKQIQFYLRLAEHPSITEDERKRGLEWLAEKATRQTIKDQIDALKRLIESRSGRTAPPEPVGVASSDEPPLEKPGYME
jgi:hypothetical protein